jgi:hypothetical protein
MGNKIMINWITDRLPPSQDIKETCNTYYLVKMEHWEPVKAMYCNGEWWTSYVSKLVPTVVGWVALD